MFSVLHTVVLRALPYPRASELAMIRTHLMLQNQPDGTSMPNLSRLAAREQDLRGDDVLSAHCGERRHLRRTRRAAAGTGRPGWSGLLRGCRDAAAHRPHALPDDFDRAIAWSC